MPVMTQKYIHHKCPMLPACAPAGSSDDWSCVPQPASSGAAMRIDAVRYQRIVDYPTGFTTEFIGWLVGTEFGGCVVFIWSLRPGAAFLFVRPLMLRTYATICQSW